MDEPSDGVAGRIGPADHTVRREGVIPHLLRRAENATALILARGGSRAVPGKNFRPVAGRPCIEWTIDHARASRCVGLVAVSTDDDRIAAIARRAEAVVVPRPMDLATDTACVDDAARHAIERLEAQRLRRTMHPIAILYGNVPVRPPDLIDRALRLLASAGCDSVQSYAPVGKHHPWWTATIEEGTQSVGAWEGGEINHGVYRRQDLPAAYAPDGGVIALTRPSLFLSVEGVSPGPHAFMGADRRGIITGEGEVIDIDTEVDVMLADAALRAQRQHVGMAT